MKSCPNVRAMTALLFQISILTYVAVVQSETDPCSRITCGKGAECVFQSNLLLCVCPDDYEGDPFSECIPVITTSPEIGSSPTQHVTTENTLEIGTSTVPTTESQILNKTEVSDTTRDDSIIDSPTNFPSAPPTLSHYAHTHGQHPPMIQGTSGPSLPQSEQQHFQHVPDRNPGIINPDLSHQNEQDGFLAPTVGHPLTGFQNYRHPNPYGRLPDKFRGPTVSNIIDLNTPYYPTNTNRNEAHYHPFHPPPLAVLHQLAHSPLYPTQFNLKQPNQIPSRIETVKDPLGIYSLCRNTNNRVVCADGGQGQDISDVPFQHMPSSPPNAQGFEHRLIAIGNDNHNSFQPQLPGAEISKNRIHGNHQHSELPPHLPSLLGTINLLPNGPSSTEIHPDSSQIRQEIPPTFPESNSKPYIPQPETAEEKLCLKMCGEGSICKIFHSRPICGCPEGHTGDPSKKCFPELEHKFDYCQKHTDCKSTLLCHNSQCSDPCLIKIGVGALNISSFHDSLPNKKDSICGKNARCLVLDHIQLCSCEQNFYGNPYVGCVA